MIISLEQRQENPDPDIRVVIATADFAVIDKPSGMLSVPGKGPEKQDCAAARVRRHFPHATGPLVVHRLDMETSGLLVFGLTPEAQRELSMQFERRVTEKRYVALLDGIVEEEQGEISLPIRADIERRPLQIVDLLQGRPAVTRFRVVTREIDRTRVWFDPITGRAHQLRVHAATPREQGGIGHPILGDPLYGQSSSAPRLMLHASRLSFIDPRSGGRVEYESPPPF